MKRHLSCALAGVASFVSATVAHAAPVPTNSDFFFKPNVGVDYQYTSIDWASDIFQDGSNIDGSNLASDSLSGVNFHVGARVHKHLGFEAGYLTTETGKKHNVLGSGLDTGIKLSGFNVDALGYLPVDEAGRLELIGTVGVSRLKGTFSLASLGSESTSETKGRIGAGAQYWITDNINARGLVRYQGADYDGDVNNARTANLGLNFQF